MDNPVLPGDITKKMTLFKIHDADSSEESDLSLDEKLRNLATKIRSLKQKLDGFSDLQVKLKDEISKNTIDSSQKSEIAQKVNELKSRSAKNQIDMTKVCEELASQAEKIFKDKQLKIEYSELSETQ
jgi:hypothetical protein